MISNQLFSPSWPSLFLLASLTDELLAILIGQDLREIKGLDLQGRT